MQNLMEKIVSLCKRRGFVFPNSDIYGGMAGFYDYGPLGVELKNNIKKKWWQEIVQSRENVLGIDGAILSAPKVWEASGHIKNFSDPLVECKKCHKRFRNDHLMEKFGDKKIIKCPECGGELTEPKSFNLLVGVELGVIEGKKKKAYLRGEACQNIYLNFQNVLNSMRMKIPFGIAQIGKAFRNEITCKNFLFRQREFEQWDLEWFVNPKNMKKWYEYWKQERMKWYQGLIIQKGKIRFRQHREDELSHYAKVAYDIEYETPLGWKEWEGIHWRGDWDLSRHGEFSGKDFRYTDPITGEKFLPWIVETSGGVDRTFLFLLLDAYHEQQIKGKKRIVLQLRKDLAPISVAVFPLLSNKAELIKKAREVYKMLKQDLKINIDWDDRGNIGKRYYSQDEIGTPYCVTIDFDSLQNKDVTLRDRDSMKQQRIKIKELSKTIKKLLE